MEQRISLVTLGVSDLAKDRAFYEGLGWRAQYKDEEIAFFQAGGRVFGLWPWSPCRVGRVDGRIRESGGIRLGSRAQP